MSAKANYFKIGLFVLVSCFIGLVALVYLGAGSYGKPKIYFETYLDESVQGLSVGSLLKVRGVQVGYVESIEFVTNKYNINIDSEDYEKVNKLIRIVIVGEIEDFHGKTMMDIYNGMSELITQGMRVRLTTQALTGIASLEMDFFDSERYPISSWPWTPEFFVIPTAPSMISTFTESADKLLTNISDIDFAKTIESMTSLIDNLNKEVVSANIGDMSNEGILLIKELRSSNESLKKLLITLDDKISKINVEQLNNESVSLLNEARDTNKRLAEFLTGSDGEMVTDIPELVKSLDILLKSSDGFIEASKPDITEAIQGLKELVKNLMEISEELKHNPGSLLSKPAKVEVTK